MNNDFGKIDKKTLEAARNGDKDALMKNLKEDDRKKIEEVLADKEKLNKILNSDAAQKLMKLLGGKKNG